MNYIRSQAKAYTREHMRGIWAAIPYPFTADDELDEPGLRKNVSYYIENKLLDGIFCGHFMSEFYSLTTEERKRAAETVIDEARGRVPVVVQTGHHSAKETVGLTHHAEKIGATYACIGNPYFLAKLDEALFQYYRYITDRTDIPILLSNAAYTGVRLSPDLINRLADLENIAAIKNPAPMLHTVQTIQLAGDRLVVSNPSDSEWIVYVAKFGMQVYMASPSPYTFQRPGYTPIMDYATLALKGELEKATALAFKLEPFWKVREKWLRAPWVNRGVLSIAYLKVWCDLMGQAGGPPRLPLLPVTPAEREEMRRDLESVGLI